MDGRRVHTPGKTVLSFSASYISYAHTVLAYSAFCSALLIGSALHFKQIVKNDVAGWPQEWFPSVSATIGDWFPERSIFQIGIALSAGPRFMLVFCWYLLARVNQSYKTRSALVLAVGVLRTFACGGWVYITSSDDHDWHDIFMILYLLLCIPWMTGVISANKEILKFSGAEHARGLKLRKILIRCFLGTMVPGLYFFIQHKVHRIPGAYTYYAFLEWSLIIYDIGFDAVTILDFNRFEIRIVDVGNFHGGANHAGTIKPYAVPSTDSKSEKSANRPQTSLSWRDIGSYIVDAYLATQFWTILTSLGVCVWYFPLWHMGISGYEAFVMTTLSPVILCFGPLKRLLATRKMIGLVHLSSVIGIYAYKFEQPELRLSLVGLGVACASLALALETHVNSYDVKKLEMQAIFVGLGLIGSSLLKLVCRSNNPFWPIMHGANGGHNGLGIALGMLAAFEYSSRTESRLTSVDPAKKKKRLASQKDSRIGNSAAAACGLAATLFSLHALLSDSGTIITWVWEGYPIRGPRPIPHGAVTIVGSCLAILVSAYRPRACRSYWAYFLAILGATVLHYYHGWYGYVGGLAIALYALASLPFHLRACSRHAPGQTFLLAFLIYNILVLANVWVVAYAFVPGGPYLRERTWLILVAVVLLSGAGLVNDKASAKKEQAERPLDQVFSGSHLPLVKLNLIFFTMLAIGISLHRLPKTSFKPYHPSQKSFVAGIWTVHFGLDNGMWDSNYRMRDLIRDMEVDVIGLLESDLQRIIMGNRDMTQFLGEELGMYTDIGPGPNKHTWGAALLSKFPILNSTHHLLPSPNGELAPAIHATLDVYGTEVDVIVSHNGQEEDPLDRELQTKALAKIMRDRYPRPFVFLGYVVTKPLEGIYHHLITDGRMHDVDPTDWDRWCEYIAYRGLKRVGYARVSRSTITDTELQLAKFQVLPPETDWYSVADDANLIRIPEEDIAPDLRFPEAFKGQGLRGHFYHVFDRPRYYG